MAGRRISATAHRGRPTNNNARVQKFKQLFEKALTEYGVTKAELARRTQKAVGVSAQWLRERCRRDRGLDLQHGRQMRRMLVAYRLDEEIRLHARVPHSPAHDALSRNFPEYLPSWPTDPIGCIVPPEAHAPLAERLAAAIANRERSDGYRVNPERQARYAAAIQAEMQKRWLGMTQTLRLRHFVRMHGGKAAHSLIALLDDIGAIGVNE